MSVALALQLKGEVVQSNLPEFRAFVSERLGEVNTTLTSEEDFGQAELDVKALIDLQGGIVAAKNNALAEARDLTAILDQLDEVTEDVRQVRLTLDKAVKGQKAKIREGIIVEYLEMFGERADIAKIRTEPFRAVIEEAVKGKRSPESMRAAAEQVVLIKVGEVEENREMIRDFLAKGEREDLVPDQATLWLFDPRLLPAELEMRIERQKQQAARRDAEAKAAKAEKEVADLKEEKKEASKPPAAPSPQCSPATEAEEWEAYKAALFEAIGPMRAKREALTFEGNKMKANKFANALILAWKEVA